VSYPSPTATTRSTATLFRPYSVGTLELANRIVMAPMTRAFARSGVPDKAFADYYRRRAEGEVGLIITQGTWVPHPTASNNSRVPRFYGEGALRGWKRVVDAVHEAGGRIIPQLWHVGLVVRQGDDPPAPSPLRIGPSGLAPPRLRVAEPMNQRDIDEVIDAFATSAAAARALGFDGVELHGAHGYLLDQFFWSRTNRRSDLYGGGSVQRTRFASELVQEVKRRTGADFPLSLRFSQWKLHDYSARLVRSPAQLERWLEPLVAAGVDIFHCSTRRFWEPEFPGSNLNLAGWTKKLTGKTVITVGSVGLDQEFQRRDLQPQRVGLDPLLERLDRDEFDLVAIGRSLIANPNWGTLVREGAFESLAPYRVERLDKLI
jgi:2,4-dienoyl-CoA reductase-like NADH-dependent reductase (Old Yellow Enzyme family)